MDVNKNSGGVLWARWAMAAVVTSPPQLSSIVIAMPSETQRSRACRALVKPPNLLILMLTTSMARSAWPRSRGSSESITSSSTNGWSQWRRIGQAFVVGAAGLFDVDVHVADGADHAQGVVHQPAGIGVGDQAIAGLQLGRDRADAVDVDQRIAADLELEPAITLGAIAGHALRHRLGRFLRDRAIENEVIAVSAPQEHANGLAGRLAEDVPAGHVDRRLHVGVALEGGVHPPVQLAELSSGPRRASAAPARRCRSRAPWA